MMHQHHRISMRARDGAGRSVAGCGASCAWKSSKSSGVMGHPAALRRFALCAAAAQEQQVRVTPWHDIVCMQSVGGQQGLVF